jgi:hypothetical protein
VSATFGSIAVRVFAHNYRKAHLPFGVVIVRRDVGVQKENQQFVAVLGETLSQPLPIQHQTARCDLKLAESSKPSTDVAGCHAEGVVQVRRQQRKPQIGFVRIRRAKQLRCHYDTKFPGRAQFNADAVGNLP